MVQGHEQKYERDMARYNDLMLKEYERNIHDPRKIHLFRLSNYMKYETEKNLEYVLKNCEEREKLIWILYNYKDDINKIKNILQENINITEELELWLQEFNEDYYKFYIHYIKN
jgi:hypothetical protein